METEEDDVIGLHLQVQLDLADHVCRVICIQFKAVLRPVLLWCCFQDKSADFSPLTSVGVRNTIFALLVSGVYEVLIEYEFFSANYEQVFGILWPEF